MRKRRNKKKYPYKFMQKVIKERKPFSLKRQIISEPHPIELITITPRPNIDQRNLYRQREFVEWNKLMQEQFVGKYPSPGLEDRRLPNKYTRQPYWDWHLNRFSSKENSNFIQGKNKGGDDMDFENKLKKIVGEDDIKTYKGSFIRLAQEPPIEEEVPPPEEPVPDTAEELEKMLKPKPSPDEARETEKPEDFFKSVKPDFPESLKTIPEYDKAKFFALEKARVEAINSMDIARLKYVDSEIEKLIKRYAEPIPLPSPMMETTRLASLFYDDYDEKQQVVYNVLKDIIGLGVIVAGISKLQDNDKTYEFMVEIQSPFAGVYDMKRVAIVRVDKDTGKLLPYFWDSLGNRYSLDEASLKEFFKAITGFSNDYVVYTGGF